MRTLAAVDLHGRSGTVLRRRLVTVEFFAGVVLLGALGAWVLVTATSAGAVLGGVWFIGMACNYLPLAIYAVLLPRRDAAKAEIASERYGELVRQTAVTQLLILVPFALVLRALIGR